MRETLLVAEDHQSARELISYALEGEGYNLVFAETGSEAAAGGSGPYRRAGVRAAARIGPASAGGFAPAVGYAASNTSVRVANPS